jgi:hypothetical protein
MKKKVAVVFIMLFSLFVIFGGYYIVRTLLSKNSINAKTESEKTKEGDSQYRLAFNDLKGNKVLTVHLLKGPATFEIANAGSGQYNFYLTTPQGQLVHQITKGDGDANFKGNFEISETADYILEAKTDGNWTFKYK